MSTLATLVPQFVAFLVAHNHQHMNKYYLNHSTLTVAVFPPITWRRLSKNNRTLLSVLTSLMQTVVEQNWSSKWHKLFQWRFRKPSLPVISRQYLKIVQPHREKLSVNPSICNKWWPNEESLKHGLFENYYGRLISCSNTSFGKRKAQKPHH